MKIPHVIDYYWGDDDSIVNMPTKLCIIEEVGKKDVNNTTLTIRLIHHFGTKVFLGRKKTIKAIIFEKLNGENGIVHIMDLKNQYLVPRCSNCEDSAKITLYSKSIYHIKEKELLKEIVLENNRPKVIDYELESFASFTDEGRGVKGSLYRKGDYNEVMVF